MQNAEKVTCKQEWEEGMRGFAPKVEWGERGGGIEGDG